MEKIPNSPLKERSEHGFHDNELKYRRSSMKRSCCRNKATYSSYMKILSIYAVFLLLNGCLGASAEEVLLSRADNITNKLDFPGTSEVMDGNNTVDIPGTSEVIAGNNTVGQSQLDIPDSFVTSMPTAAPMPSATPSTEPSMVPSVIPSSSPSVSPTMYPTFTPVPTDQPSFSPTDMPSASPSDVPSAVPTLSCHDVAAYRSPINNFSCEHHANTDCMQWRFLGLNLTDLQELAENCPVTCDIDCGYFTSMDSNISFIISSVPSLIDDLMTREPLELVTLDYLTEYILEKSPISKFALTRAELLFQEPLNSTMAPRHNNTSRNLTPSLRRSLQNATIQDDAMINLQVKMNLQGYKIYPINIVLTDLLLEGIDSPGYTAELRKSDDFYANATASSAIQAKPRQVNAPDPPERKKISPLAISIVLAGIACAAVFGALLYKKHARLLKSKQRNLPMDTGDTPQYSTGSIRPNVFSFDLSPQSSTGLGRLLAVFSSEGTGSRDTTSPSSSQETSPSPQKQKAVVEEHPLSGIIPPMLVIDNIEKPDSNMSMRVIPESQRSKKKNVVPTKRMHASESFIEALNNNSSGKEGSASSFSELM